MPEGVGAANGFGGNVAPANVGEQQAAPQVQPQQPQQQQYQQPQQYQQTPNNQGVQGQQQQQELPEHVKRSILSSAEQTWTQKNQTALDLEVAIRQMGRDPSQVLQQVREAAQQAQMEAQQQQAQGMGVSPQLLEQMQAMQQQVQSVSQVIGQQRLEQAEKNLTAFAGQYGVNYDDPQTQMEIRQFALTNNVNLDFAFKSLYFDRINQVTAQQAAGQQLAAMQGRAPQPFSSAVPGSTQQGPVDYLSMSDSDFAKVEAQMKSQYNQR